MLRTGQRRCKKIAIDSPCIYLLRILILPPGIVNQPRSRGGGRSFYLTKEINVCMLVPWIGVCTARVLIKLCLLYGLQNVDGCQCGTLLGKTLEGVRICYLGRA